MVKVSKSESTGRRAIGNLSPDATLLGTSTSTKKAEFPETLPTEDRLPPLPQDAAHVAACINSKACPLDPTLDGEDKHIWYALGVRLALHLREVQQLTVTETEWEQVVSGTVDTLTGKLEDERQTKILHDQGDDLNTLVTERTNTIIVSQNKLSLPEWATRKQGAHGRRMPKKSRPSSVIVTGRSATNSALPLIKALTSSGNNNIAAFGSVAPNETEETADSSRPTQTARETVPGAYSYVSPLPSSALSQPEAEDVADLSPLEVIAGAKPIEATLVNHEKDNDADEAPVAVATKMTLLDYFKEPRVLVIFFLVIIAVAVGVAVPMTLSQTSPASLPMFDVMPPPSRTEEFDFVASVVEPAVEEYDLSMLDEASEWLSKDPLLYNYTNSTIVQRYALAAFYYRATDGSRMVGNNSTCAYDSSPGWPESVDEYSDECTWMGISCNNDTEIDNVDLRRRNFSGSIPEELSLLDDSLEILDLSFNDFSGTIPKALGGLAKLEYLSLAANDLTGRLPTEFGSLRQLWALKLDGNEYTGVLPDEICQLREEQNLIQLTIGCCVACACCSFCPSTAHFDGH